VDSYVYRPPIVLTKPQHNNAGRVVTAKVVVKRNNLRLGIYQSEDIEISQSNVGRLQPNPAFWGWANVINPDFHAASLLSHASRSPIT
jgi:hypothetical protein